jgi:hypothetical protein
MSLAIGHCIPAGTDVSSSPHSALPVPKNDPLHALVALASDLLAQSEAQQRTGRRLEAAVQLLAAAARDGGVSSDLIGEVQSHVESMRRLVDTEAALLADFERELSGAAN